MTSRFRKSLWKFSRKHDVLKEENIMTGLDVDDLISVSETVKNEENKSRWEILQLHLNLLRSFAMGSSFKCLSSNIFILLRHKGSTASSVLLCNHQGWAGRHRQSCRENMSLEYHLTLFGVWPLYFRLQWLRTVAP